MFADGKAESPEEAAQLATLVRLAGERGLGKDFAAPEPALRFLRARKNDVKPALEMLVKYAAWRAETTPWWPAKGCPLEHIEKPLKRGVAYFDGETPQGHPLLWVRPRLHDKNEERIVVKRFISALNDEAGARINRPPHYATQHAIVLDFEVSRRVAGGQSPRGVPVGML